MVQVRKVSILIIVIGMGMLAALSCSDDNGTNSGKIGPRLSIPDATFDFGFVPQGAVISHTFRLHSTGDETLTITRIVPG